VSRVAPSRFVDDVLGALFPVPCPCGDRRTPCCERCEAALRPAPVQPPPPGIDWWEAPYAYEGVARELVARAKYRNARIAIAWFGAAIARACRARFDRGEVDVITWAPASAARRRANGVDHGESLARAVARIVDAPARRLLVRDDAIAQTGADRLARRRGPALHVLCSVVAGRVLVIDDVATTGATLTAAARALREAGAWSVGAATATRTPRPGDH
jgi:predicted amidophosphoribosyltransferase